VFCLVRLRQALFAHVICLFAISVAIYNLLILCTAFQLGMTAVRKYASMVVLLPTISQGLTSNWSAARVHASTRHVQRLSQSAAHEQHASATLRASRLSRPELGP